MRVDRDLGAEEGEREAAGPRFHSILFQTPDDEPGPGDHAEPACFHDLNLDQVVAAITGGREEYALATFFHVRLRDLEAIAYRQEVMRELEDDAVATIVRTFSQGMREMRGHLERRAKLYDDREKQHWFLRAVDMYCVAVAHLTHDLGALELRSRGLRALAAFLARYVTSQRFERLTARVAQVESALAAIRYCVLVEGNEVTVRHLEAEPDYGAVVESVFARFRRGTTKDYHVQFRDLPGLNHVEAQVLEGVATLNPEAFRGLAEFCASEADYCDPTIATFDREVQFYLAVLEHVARLRGAGLSFCYPQLSTKSKDVDVRSSFDLALAHELARAKAPVVCNDVLLSGAERVLVVSGPNQGGKTTFARMFGQLHYLAGLGCPVPGTRARLFLCDQVLTHFERQEDVATRRGKLHDELVRLRELLDEATPRSIVILNELFASTTLADAVLLSRRIMARLLELHVVGVWVSFLDELATLDERTVSVVSTIDPADPTVRTFKLERRSPDGLAYAVAIAEKHRVTYRWLMRRIAP